jgi:hypothetical protein
LLEKIQILSCYLCFRILNTGLNTFTVMKAIIHNTNDARITYTQIYIIDNINIDSAIVTADVIKLVFIESKSGESKC